MDILFDTAVLLDLADKTRPGHANARRAFIRARERSDTIWCSASQAEQLIQHLQENRSSAEQIQEFLGQARVCAVTGADIRAALTLREPAAETATIRGFRRTVPHGVVIMQGKESLTTAESLSVDMYLGERSVTERHEQHAIPMLDLQEEYRVMCERIDDRLLSVAAEARYILGSEVGEFEEAVARHLEVSYAVGVSSGTDALVLALRALAIARTGREYFTEDDEIITTPFTFTATGEAILRAGATPVFVDIDPATYNLDPALIQNALSERTVGILPVHLYGLPCDMDPIMETARKHKLFVVEDVAQAFGASYKGKRVGGIGDVGCLSFFPSKNLGAFGDGGMCTTNDPQLAELIGMLRKHGGRDKYNVDHIGYNARLDTIQAALLLVRMKFIDEFTKRRRAISAAYLKGLKNVPAVRLPTVGGENEFFHVYHQFTVNVDRRDDLQAFLKERGIASMVYYPVPLNHMKVFGDRARIPETLRHAEEAARHVLSLPVEPLQSDAHTNRVIDAIRAFFPAP